MVLLRKIRNSSAEPQLRLASSKGETILLARKVGLDFLVQEPESPRREKSIGKFFEREKLEEFMQEARKEARESGLKGAKWRLIPGASY